MNIQYVDTHRHMCYGGAVCKVCEFLDCQSGMSLGICYFGAVSCARRFLGSKRGDVPQRGSSATWVITFTICPVLVFGEKHAIDNK